MYQFRYQFDLLFMAYKRKNGGTKKEKRARELQEFRSTFNSLRVKLTLEEMEKITGIAKSNLSAYGSGKKNPSEATIKRFYSKLKTHIAKLSRQDKMEKNDEQGGRVEEESSAYRLDGSGQRGKKGPKSKKENQDRNTQGQQNKQENQNQDLWGKMFNLYEANTDRMWAENERNAKRFDNILENNNKLVNNNTKLVESNTQLVANNSEIAANNTRLIDKVLSNSGH